VANTASFEQRFQQAADRWSPFCFGCDPSVEILRAWSLALDLKGLDAFCDIVLEAAAGSVGLIKPQVAFFEALGPGGYDCLRRLIAGARERGLLVIADAKRGDIGTSVDAYSRAWLGEESPFRVDAITVNAYLGLGSLDPMFRRASQTGTGVFVVVRSSNPEGATVQDSTISGLPLADNLAQGITSYNVDLCEGLHETGPVGAVIGATRGSNAARTIGLLPRSLFLVPGLGAQGATMTDVARQFGQAADRAIPSSSRAVLLQGPDISALRKALSLNVGEARLLREFRLDRDASPSPPLGVTGRT
jgi:orotidine-5'-phosphate decarboxylase